MARRSAVPRAQAGQPGLALHEAAGRAEALLKERERLLRDVNKKKQQIAQARAKSERDEQAAVGAMAPIVERHATLVRELIELFDELLVRGRLLARARNQVKKVRRSLELQGLLPPLVGTEPGKANDGADEQQDDDWSEEPRADAAGDGRSTNRRGRPHHPHAASDSSARDVASARQPSPERRSLRDIFGAWHARSTRIRRGKSQSGRGAPR